MERQSQAKQSITALYIPLADHYAALVAYEKYREQMLYADFHIKQMQSWDLLRAYFQSEYADMAFVMSPLAMDMFLEKENFRWIGLMHRDGNALAINEAIKQKVKLANERQYRKPTAELALAIKQLSYKQIRPLEIAVPHIKSTHTVVLYKFLSQHNVRLGFDNQKNVDVRIIDVAPTNAPLHIKSQSNRGIAAAFEQSLPWADVVETGGFGYVAWYSKDVLTWPQGHVECITLVKDDSVLHKTKAVREVNRFLRKAGADIEAARAIGGPELEQIVAIIRKHIPAHNRAAIIASLSPHLNVINYHDLHIDKAGLEMIMTYSVRAGILAKPINIEEFALEEGEYE
ncbi:ABC transporter substrate-binding protein [Catenovulum agarivorans]|uniref:ABC transporter substrate-binding protein n=1 Tax=Catenovulum agarivorans TaxID=1172192 RepID=UPI0002D9F44D|nr:ABC transporter substrate-binding protein [Catenovulum agarivorans]